MRCLFREVSTEALVGSLSQHDMYLNILSYIQLDSARGGEAGQDSNRTTSMLEPTDNAFGSAAPTARILGPWFKASSLLVKQSSSP